MFLGEVIKNSKFIVQSKMYGICNPLSYSFVFTHARVKNNMSLQPDSCKTSWQPHVYQHSWVRIVNKLWMQFFTMQELCVHWGDKMKISSSGDLVILPFFTLYWLWCDNVVFIRLLFIPCCGISNMMNRLDSVAPICDFSRVFSFSTDVICNCWPRNLWNCT